MGRHQDWEEDTKQVDSWRFQVDLSAGLWAVRPSLTPAQVGPPVHLTPKKELAMQTAEEEAGSGEKGRAF